MSRKKERILGLGNNTAGASHVKSTRGSPLKYYILIFFFPVERLTYMRGKSQIVEPLDTINQFFIERAGVRF